MKKLLIIALLLFATSSFAQVGTIRMSFDGTPSTNELALDGSAFSITAYPKLDSVLALSGNYVSGVLPNMQGRSPIGVGTGAGLNNTYTSQQTFGEEKHTLTQSEMPSHSHDLKCYSGNSNKRTGAGNVLAAVQGTFTNIYSNQPTDGALATSSISNSGNNTPHENVHPVLAVYYFVTAQ